MIRNQFFQRSRALAVSAVLIFSSSQAFSWGSKGHQIVAGVGANISGVPFWSNNTAAVQQLSTVPDRVWKSTNYKQEALNHWFQADAYTTVLGKGSLANFPRSYQDALKKYGESAILTNGVSPWRIQQFYNGALAALKKGDAPSALAYMGLMSHYLGDLSQPLHVTTNYDGQKTNQPGIHKYFETDNIQDEQAIAKQVQDQAIVILQNPSNLNILMNLPLIELSFTEIERALMFRDKVLSNDSKLGRSGAGAKAQLSLAISRMADGAAIYAVILNRVWKEAQSNIPPNKISIGDPSFIPDDFSKLFSFQSDKRMTSVNENLASHEDDCEL